MFNPAPRRRLEYDTGFFFPTGTVVVGGAITTRTNGKRMRGEKIDGVGEGGSDGRDEKGRWEGVGALNGSKGAREQIAAGTVLGGVHTRVC
jgi:hypothetical protein